MKLRVVPREWRGVAWSIVTLYTLRFVLQLYDIQKLSVMEMQLCKTLSTA